MLETLKQKPWIVRVLAVFLIAGIALTVGALWSRERNIVLNVREAQADAGELPDHIPEGTESWRDVQYWTKVSDSGVATRSVPPHYGDFLEAELGFAREDVGNFVKDEERGAELKVKLLKGNRAVVNGKTYAVRIRNTGYDWEAEEYLFLEDYALKEDTFLLVAPDGYVPVKERRNFSWNAFFAPVPARADVMDMKKKATAKEVPKEGVVVICGNPAAVELVEVTEEVVKKEIRRPKRPKKKICPPAKPPRNKFDHTTPHWEKNPFTTPPDHAAVKTPTPGASPPDVIENVKQEQDERKEGSTDYGATGPDTGGSNNPDGSVTPSPPPGGQDVSNDEYHSGDPGEPN